MNRYQASVLVRMENELGEGPMWHPHSNRLYWVDILKKVIYFFDPVTESLGRFEPGKYVSSVAPADGAKIIATLQNEIVEVDVSAGSRKKLADIEMHRVDNRCNDGKCDGQGRLWIGTMQIDAQSQQGSLYRLNRDLSLKKILSRLTIPNGLGWSPDHQKMYFIDSVDRCVRSYTFDLPSGDISNERVCIDTRGKAPLPDGMCVDSEGMLWIAFWGGSRVGRYNPETGEHLADIDVPSPHVTSCTFGGKDYQTLYITTAREGLSRKELEHYPLSGSLFSCRLPVRGSKANCFRP